MFSGSCVSIVSVFVIIVSLFCYFIEENSTFLNFIDGYKNKEDRSDVLLVIGITSAQENFARRQTLRSTWLKLANDKRIKYYFLVGEIFCPIPPEYRLSVLSCREWKPNLDHDTADSTAQFSAVKEVVEELERNVSKGFSFILNHDIIIHQIGIKSSVMRNCDEPTRVVLKDTISGEKVVTSTYSTNHHEEGIVWKKVQAIHLPLGFEGQLYAEGGCDLSLERSTLNLKLYDSTNIIRFLQISINNNTYGYRKNSSSIVTFLYTISGLEELKMKINLKENYFIAWNDYVREVRSKLKEEADTYKDILFLNFVDVYHNLPLKMLNFYRWTSANLKYEYLLKTDDDVFIDLPNVMKELAKANDWKWWSCFRSGWPVQRAGKWRETNVNISVYPPFPSGAGYVLHKTITKHLLNNIERLDMNAQGEDVSLGIWLDALNPNPKRHQKGDKCQWACHKGCSKRNCNVMELTANEISTVWEKFRNCNGSFCWCP